jgi:peptide/nickel transport system permease protein
MVSQGASTMITGQWWTALFPGLALATAVLGFALVGDGLRIYLDPKQRTQLQRVVGQEIVNPVDAPAV